jgi:mRNA interferase MazF
MVSSQLGQEVPVLDEILTPDDSDFRNSGLKLPSVIRVCRFAAVNGDILIGKIGQINNIRLVRIKKNLAQWIQGM